MTDEQGWTTLTPPGSIPISAIEHFAYCPRQALLIHQENYFDANVDTVRGDLAHAAVDRGGAIVGRDATVWRSVQVWSATLGLHGVCDTVHVRDGLLVPVEHKSGTYRPGGPADLQVAAQVVCLREMHGTDVDHGEVYSGRTRRRYPVVVDADMVDRLTDIVNRLRAALQRTELPAPVNDRRCVRCSLQAGCVPDIPTGPADLFSPRTAADWPDED
ncbi:CRISPR-associated protein Cas4 [Actinokineospora sp. UTMC 2448]|uniref:CRISPR-associated protein Cas4 n=1 Tax=Actinokineospora sp. UTMC 2448 TaxID=2268449 RepID=UPI0021647153|nr:CRISPR-associated protein Cas4 [Actinokineospora sp. UTMC 2448]UVS80615.1 CRISPR-associated protein Cas4/endonuclease Cas1 fusion [Actinokineospora sp. UTMC 2448]